MEEKKLLNKVVIIIFCTQKVFSSLHNIKVEPLVTWTILTMSLLPF